MGIVDKVLGGLSDKEHRQQFNSEDTTRNESGPAALAQGKPAEYTVDDRIGGDHTRIVKDAVTHENVRQHADHEVTPIVNRQKEETEIHQKVQPVLDNQEVHTHHQHNAPAVSRTVNEGIKDDHADRYRAQGDHRNETRVHDQTHATSVNAPIVREHVNKHIVEEVQPIIERQTQRVEHHHTTQAINETHVKAPKVHETVVNQPISMSDFAGKVGGLASGATHGSHGTHESSTHGTGLTGSNHGSSTTHGTGLTGSNHGTGLTGSNHGTGLQGVNNDGTGRTGDFNTRLTGDSASGANHTHDNNQKSGGLLSKLTGSSDNKH